MSIKADENRLFLPLLQPLSSFSALALVPDSTRAHIQPPSHPNLPPMIIRQPLTLHMIIDILSIVNKIKLNIQITPEMWCVAVYRSRNVVLSEKIFAALRLEIITGKLRPGDRIVEMKVADSFGTSQAPVREALQRLGQEGLVETVRHTGTFVSRMSFSEIEQLFEMRRLIETTSGGILLKRASDDDIHQLQQAFDSMLDAAHAGSVIQLVASDVEFHRLLIERAQQNVFLRLWSTMDGQIRRFIANVSMKYYDEMVTFARRHQPILDAICARDEQKLIRELTGHLALNESWRSYLQ